MPISRLAILAFWCAALGGCATFQETSDESLEYRQAIVDIRMAGFCDNGMADIAEGVITLAAIPWPIARLAVPPVIAGLRFYCTNKSEENRRRLQKKLEEVEKILKGKPEDKAKPSRNKEKSVRDKLSRLEGDTNMVSLK